MPTGAGEEEADTGRYYTLLECLLGRVSDALARRPGEHVVALHVCTRDVSEPDGRRVRLDPSHLEACLDRARLARVGNVRLVPATTPAYRGPLDARLVLADFVANHARRVLGRNRPLRVVHGLLGPVTVGEVESGRPPLSHLAASGWARAHVEAARARVASTPPPADVRAWAQEQAERWAAALGAGR
jgi:hypothetical protein